MAETIAELTSQNQALNSQLLGFHRLFGAEGDRSFQELEE